MEIQNIPNSQSNLQKEEWNWRNQHSWLQAILQSYSHQDNMAIELPYNSAIPLLGICPKETRIERDTHIPKFIAALFIISRTWKQPRCQLADEWIRKLWYIYTMKYHSSINRNAFESVLMRWMNLEPIIQSEVSQKEKYNILTHIYGI